MWNNAERLRDKWLETVREAQADATAHIENNTYDSDAQERFQRKFDQGVEFRKEAEELEARNAAAGAHAMRTLENFSGGGAPDLNLNRTFATEGSLFEQRRRQGWRTPGAERFENLEFGQWLRSMVSGPQSETEYRALAEGSDGAGGHLTPEPLSMRVFDLLRANLVVRQAGAEVMGTTGQSLKFAKLASDVGLTWRPESSTDSATDPTFTAITLTPRTLRGIVRASRELVMDARNIEAVLQNSFISSMARELDRVCLVGAGSTATEPAGLSGSTSITTIPVNGQLTYSPLITAVETLMAQNANVSRVAAIMSPRSWGQLARLEEASTGLAGQPIRMPPGLDNVNMLVTSAVPNTFSSTGSTAASSVFLGDFSQFIVGNRVESRVELLKERYASNFEYGWLGFLRADCNWQNDGSFVTVTSVTT